MKRRLVLGGLAGIAATACARVGGETQVSSTVPAGLEAALQAAAASADGTLCATVLTVTPNTIGPPVSVNGATACPMHSTAKVFVAAWAFEEIAAGRLSAAREVTLTREAFPVRGVGRVDRVLEAEGRVTASVSHLLDAMVLDSDNAATDGLISLAGGAEVIAQALDLPPSVPFRRGMGQVYALFGGREPTMVQYQAFLAEPSDQTTPVGYATCLARLAWGRLGSEQGDARTRALMEASPLGADRLKAGLGDAWRLQGRTGTGPSVAGRRTGLNHVGLAIHKTSGRTLAIAAFLRDSSGDDAARAASLAAVGRAVAHAWPEG